MARPPVYLCVSHDAMTETLPSVERWIEAIVSDFQRHYGGTSHDREDRVQEAKLAFVHALSTWEPQRSSFPVYLRLKVFARLFSDYRRKLDRRSRGGAVEECVGYSLDTTPGRSDTFSRRLLEDDLGEDARDLVGMVLDGEVGDLDQLWQRARDMGWCVRRFDAAFDQVRGVL